MVKVNEDGFPDPWLSKISLEILKFRFSLYMAKMIEPPLLLDCPVFYQKFLKFRFSVHMVKDAWPPSPSWLPSILPENLKV